MTSEYKIYGMLSLYNVFKDFQLIFDPFFSIIVYIQKYRSDLLFHIAIAMQSLLFLHTRVSFTELQIDNFLTIPSYQKKRSIKKFTDMNV